MRNWLPLLTETQSNVVVSTLSMAHSQMVLSGSFSRRFLQLSFSSRVRLLSSSVMPLLFYQPSPFLPPAKSLSSHLHFLLMRFCFRPIFCERLPTSKRFCQFLTRTLPLKLGLVSETRCSHLLSDNSASALFLFSCFTTTSFCSPSVLPINFWKFFTSRIHRVVMEALE